MIPVNEGPLGKWFSQETVVHWSSDSCLWALYSLFFLIENVFLVDGASWVFLLKLRVDISRKILVEDIFMTFMALRCNFMEMVYRPWGKRLSIHQVLGSLKLIGVAKTSNLFLITFFHVKCLLLSYLRPSRTPTRKRVVKRWNDKTTLRNRFGGKSAW